MLHQVASAYGAEIHRLPGLDDIYVRYATKRDIEFAVCRVSVSLWVFNDRVEYQCGYTGRKTQQELDALNTVVGRLIEYLNEKKVKYKYWKGSTYAPFLP
jgi:hypothetical protein